METLKKEVINESSGNWDPSNLFYSKLENNCKIYLSKSVAREINNPFDKKRKPLIEERNAEIEKVKTQKSNLTDTYQALQVTFLTRLKDAEERSIANIEQFCSKTRDEIYDSYEKYNTKAIDIINKYQRLEWEKIESYITKVKPILNKFEEDKNVFDLSSRLNKYGKKVKIQNNEQLIDTVISTATDSFELNPEEKEQSISKTSNNLKDFLPAFQVLPNITVSGEVLTLGDKSEFSKTFDMATQTLVSKIKSVFDFKKGEISGLLANLRNIKLHYELVKPDNIKDLVYELSSAMKSSIEKHEKYIEDSTDIFSKRRKKIENTIKSLVENIDKLNDETNIALEEIILDLKNELGNILEARNNNIRSSITRCTEMLKIELKSITQLIENEKSIMHKQKKELEKEEAVIISEIKEKNKMKIEKIEINLSDKNLNGIIFLKENKLDIKIIKISSKFIYFEYTDLITQQVKKDFTSVTNVCKMKD
ncbi:hypothetical protein CPAV1605_1288 [seawater metagenome]|uniref:Uncharacterized protein n=1 Tax=seawater metagenome TaxID=1561972 RepID=A0A5E8CKE8_9ZZZZ